MPIEIKELIIRATIDNESDKKSGKAKGGSGSGGADIIETCVEKVLEILEKQKQR